MSFVQLLIGFDQDKSIVFARNCDERLCLRLEYYRFMYRNLIRLASGFPNPFLGFGEWDGVLVTSTRLPYDWNRRTVIKFDVTSARPYRFDVFVAKVASKDDINRELLDNIELDNFQPGAEFND